MSHFNATLGEFKICGINRGGAQWEDGGQKQNFENSGFFLSLMYNSCF